MVWLENVRQLVSCTSRRLLYMHMRVWWIWEFYYSHSQCFFNTLDLRITVTILHKGTKQVEWINELMGFSKAKGLCALHSNLQLSSVKASGANALSMNSVCFQHIVKTLFFFHWLRFRVIFPVEPNKQMLSPKLLRSKWFAKLFYLNWGERRVA